MRFSLDYGLDQATFDLSKARIIPNQRPELPRLTDIRASVHAALEKPVAFPALRLALTPDDHVAIVVDDALPNFLDLLVPTLEHVLAAGVAPSAVTLLSPPGTSSQAWLEELPEACQEVHVEVHDPTDRRKLAYLATTKKGRRLYLNRTAVDADQVVVLSGRRYDPLLGHGGAEGSLYPALCDEETRQELSRQIQFEAPEDEPWPLRAEAIETAWLLGVPFLIQVIEGQGDHIAVIVAGSAEASLEGRRLQDKYWRCVIPQAVDLVVASICGDPSRHSFADLAAAVACASRVVKPDGRIILLTQAKPTLGPETDLLVQAESPEKLAEDLRQNPDLPLVPAIQWAQAASHARITLLSGIPAATAEELFTTPLENLGQVQRLIDSAKSCLFLPDAHKSLAVAE